MPKRCSSCFPFKAAKTGVPSKKRQVPFVFQQKFLVCSLVLKGLYISLLNIRSWSLHALQIIYHYCERHAPFFRTFSRESTTQKAKHTNTSTAVFPLGRPPLKKQNTQGNLNDRFSFFPKTTAGPWVPRGPNASASLAPRADARRTAPKRRSGGRTWRPR